ncbi:MAG: phosphatase PAP2 family protein [bacterium]
MADGLAGALQTVGLLVLVALPASAIGGAAVFLPHDRRLWTLAYWGRLLSRHGLVIAGLLLMLIPEVVESQLDPWVTAHLPAAVQTGPTTFLSGLEGGFHEALQSHLSWGWLRPVLTTVYVAGYPFVIVACIVLPVWMDQGRLARRSLAAYAMCFLAALPFYLFVPVDEVWVHNAHVENIVNSYPLVRQHLYSFNDVNNCFPSLHTAISTALAALVWQGPMPRAFRVTMVALAAAIVFSTMYLGIHWLVDVLAGLLLAAVVVRLASKAWPEPPTSG